MLSELEAVFGWDERDISPSENRLPMNGEDRCELGTPKLSDDIEDPSIICNLKDQPEGREPHYGA